MGKSTSKLGGQFGGKVLQEGLAILRPFRSSLLVFNDSAPNLEIGQYLNQIHRMD